VISKISPMAKAKAHAPLAGCFAQSID